MESFEYRNVRRKGPIGGKSPRNPDITVFSGTLMSEDVVVFCELDQLRGHLFFPFPWSISRFMYHGGAGNRSHGSSREPLRGRDIGAFQKICIGIGH